MSAVNPKLEFARLKHLWWRTDLKKRIVGKIDQRDVEAAKVWELLRRTKTYPLLYERFNKVLRQIQENRLLFQMFPARVRSQFGDRIGFLIACGGNPILTWVDERLSQAREFLQWPFLLRQQSPAKTLTMSVFLWEITRDQKRQRISKCD